MVEKIEELKVEEAKVEESKGGDNQGDAVDVKVSATIDKDNYLRLSTGIPDVKEAPAYDLVCVVDVSYSMGEACSGVNDGHT